MFFIKKRTITPFSVQLSLIEVSVAAEKTTTQLYIHIHLIQAMYSDVYANNIFRFQPAYYTLIEYDLFIQ